MELKSFQLPLWKTEKHALTPQKDFQPQLTVSLINDGKIHPAMLVFPGGGYQSRTMFERDPIAEAFNKNGFHAFCCDYRLGGLDGNPFPAPIEDAIRAVRLIRGNAADWKVAPNQIATIGFSAGGHLAVFEGLCYKKFQAHNNDIFDDICARPDAVVTCYGVNSGFAGEHPHIGSFNNLLNKKDLTEQDLHETACDENVTPDAPPAFIWHTMTDECVPVENAINLAQAYRKNNVPYELHVFPRGPHALGLAEDCPFPEVALWVPLCMNFLKISVFQLQQTN